MAPGRPRRRVGHVFGEHLEAFDTLFNKRDYARAESYWSPNYIQHSAGIEPGAILAEGNFVIVHDALANPPITRFTSSLAMRQAGNKRRVGPGSRPVRLDLHPND